MNTIRETTGGTHRNQHSDVGLPVWRASHQKCHSADNQAIQQILKTSDRKRIASHWKDRITGQGKESPENLLANPDNWRKHPKHQQDALKGVLEGVLEEIGWIMVWTDPPHNVDYEGKTKEALKIDNDSMGNSQFRQFLRDLFTSAFTVTKEGGPIYVAHADTEGVNFRLALQEAGFYLKQVLIRVKSSSVMGRQDYHWYEPILYGWKPGATHVWYGERNKKIVIDEEPKTRELDKHSQVTEVKELRNRLCGTVIREDKPNACREHPTMKPVDLIVSMLRNSSTRGDIVLDLCAGSGSTLIACEKPGRLSRVIELDPHYCDVIIRRRERFSGQEAVLEGDGQTFEQIESG